MAQRTHIKPDKNAEFQTENSDAHFLVLYNDDFNTFEYVIKCLVEICEHSPEQAEQCATITHYKGSCDIKKGMKTELLPMQIELIKRNLKALIE